MLSQKAPLRIIVILEKTMIIEINFMVLPRIINSVHIFNKQRMFILSYLTTKYELDKIEFVMCN